jgi:hypothetical protein
VSRIVDRQKRERVCFYLPGLIKPYIRLCFFHFPPVRVVVAAYLISTTVAVSCWIALSSTSDSFKLAADCPAFLNHTCNYHHHIILPISLSPLRTSRYLAVLNIFLSSNVYDITNVARNVHRTRLPHQLLLTIFLFIFFFFWIANVEEGRVYRSAHVESKRIFFPKAKGKNVKHDPINVLGPPTKSPSFSRSICWFGSTFSCGFFLFCQEKSDRDARATN